MPRMPGRLAFDQQGRPVLIIKLTPGTPEPADGLCPQCFTPSRYSIPLHAVGEDGIQTPLIWVGCEQCGCTADPL